MARDMPIEGANRDPESFTAECVNDASARGDRGANIKLPPQWPADGVYEITKYAKTVFARVSKALRESMRVYQGYNKIEAQQQTQTITTIWREEGVR